MGPGPVCVLTPWPRFVPGTSEAVQACESPVGMQGHGLPRPHPAFVGSDEFPQHPPWRGWQNSPPPARPTAAGARPQRGLQPRWLFLGQQGPQAVGLSKLKAMREAGPTPAGKLPHPGLACSWASGDSFRISTKDGKEAGGGTQAPGGPDRSHSAPPQSDPQAERHTQAGGELMGAPGCHRDARWPSRAGGTTSPPCQALGQEQGPREDQASGPGLSAMGEKGTSLGPPSG